ncbi:MAG: FkbM family methyltransferase [Crocinitomicaceae bacterium]|nr:FkbM family methyltransferase [Crocinitomicaceae bacterium]
MGWFKDILKSRFYILKVRNRFSAEVQIGQRQLFNQYQNWKEQGKLPKLVDTGFRVFSQYEEDGKLLFIFSVIGMRNKTFVEIGSDDGINSNCANLALNFGYYGLFLDGNPRAIKRGRKFYAKYPHPWMYQPQFTCAKVTAENINQLVKEANLEGDVDLLSIDIDGNDYWIWKALEQVSPNVVIIETHVEFGMRNIVVPYDPDYSYPGKHPVYHGASPIAMVNLAKEKGYRLVGANELGFNFIFVKNGLGEDALPEVSVESVLQHPSVKESWKRFEPIKDWEFIEP